MPSRPDIDIDSHSDAGASVGRGGGGVTSDRRPATNDDGSRAVAVADSEGDGLDLGPFSSSPPSPGFEWQVLSMRRGGRVTASCDVSGCPFALDGGLHGSSSCSSDGRSSDRGGGGVSPATGSSWVVGEAAVVLARTGGVIELWTVFDGDYGENRRAFEGFDDGGDGDDISYGAESEGESSDHGGSCDIGGGDGRDGHVRGGHCRCAPSDDGPMFDSSSSDGVGARERPCFATQTQLDRMHRPCSVVIDDDRVEGLCPLPCGAGDDDRSVGAAAATRSDRADSVPSRVATLRLLASTRGGKVFLLALRCHHDGGGVGEDEEVVWTLEVEESASAATWKKGREGKNGSNLPTSTVLPNDAGEVVKAETTEKNAFDDDPPWRFVGPPRSFRLCDSLSPEDSKSDGFLCLISTCDRNDFVEIQNNAALLPLATGSCLLLRVQHRHYRGESILSPLLLIDVIPPPPLPSGFEMWPSRRIRYLCPLPGTYDGFGRPLVCALATPATALDLDGAAAAAAAAADTSSDETSRPGPGGSDADGLLLCCALESHHRKTPQEGTKQADGFYGCENAMEASCRREGGKVMSSCELRGEGSEAEFWFVPGPWSLQNVPSKMLVFPSCEEQCRTDEPFANETPPMACRLCAGVPVEDGVICITPSGVQYLSHREGKRVGAEFFPSRAWTACSYDEEESPCDKGVSSMDAAWADGADSQLLGACVLPRKSHGLEASFLICVRRHGKNGDGLLRDHHLFVASLVRPSRFDHLCERDGGGFPTLSVEAVSWSEASSTNDSNFDLLCSIAASVENGSMIASSGGVAVLGEYVCELCFAGEERLRCANLFFDGPVAAQPDVSHAGLPLVGKFGMVSRIGSKGSQKHSGMWDAQTRNDLSPRGLDAFCSLSAAEAGLFGAACTVHHDLMLDIGLESSQFIRTPLTCPSPRNAVCLTRVDNEQRSAQCKEECLLLFTSAEETLVMSCLARGPVRCSPRVNIDGIREQPPLHNILQLAPVSDPLRRVGIDPTVRTLAICVVPSPKHSSGGTLCDCCDQIVVQVTTSRIVCCCVKNNEKCGVDLEHICCTEDWKDVADSRKVTEYSVPKETQIEHAVLDSIDRTMASPVPSGRGDSFVGPLVVCALSCSDNAVRLVELCVREVAEKVDVRRCERYFFRVLQPTVGCSLGGTHSTSELKVIPRADEALISFDSYLSAFGFFSIGSLGKVLCCGERKKSTLFESTVEGAVPFGPNLVADPALSVIGYSAVFAVSPLNSFVVSIFGIRRRQSSGMMVPADVEVDLLVELSLSEGMTRQSTHQLSHAEIFSLEFLPEMRHHSNYGCFGLGLIAGFSDGVVAATSPVLHHFSCHRCHERSEDAVAVSWKKVGHCPPRLQRMPLKGKREKSTLFLDEGMNEMCEVFHGAATLSAGPYAIVASCAHADGCTPDSALILAVIDKPCNQHSQRAVEPTCVKFFPLFFRRSGCVPHPSAAQQSCGLALLPLSILREPVCCWMSAGERLNLGSVCMQQSRCSRRKSLHSLCWRESSSSVGDTETAAILHFCILESNIAKMTGRTHFGVGLIEENSGARIALFDVSSVQGKSLLWMSQVISNDKRVTAIAPCSPPPMMVPRQDMSTDESSKTPYSGIASNILQCVSDSEECAPCVSVSAVRFGSNGCDGVLDDDVVSTVHIFQLVFDVFREGTRFRMEEVGSYCGEGGCFCLNGIVDGAEKVPASFAVCASFDESIAVFSWNDQHRKICQFSTSLRLSRDLAADFDCVLGSEVRLSLSSSTKAQYPTSISAISCTFARDENDGIFIAAAQLLHSVTIYYTGNEKPILCLYAVTSSPACLSIRSIIFSRSPMNHRDLLVVAHDQVNAIIAALEVKDEACPVTSNLRRNRPHEVKELCLSTSSTIFCCDENICQLLNLKGSQQAYAAIGSEGSIASICLRYV